MLDSLLRSLGAGLPDAGQVEIVGADPVLSTRFPIGEAAAVALAACGLAAAEIWQLRGGSHQRVRVDVTGAAASLHGFAYQRVFTRSRTGVPARNAPSARLERCAAPHDLSA
jgi:hypothetical protein